MRRRWPTVETLEEQLRRELQRLSPPGDPSGVVDHVLRKAARRHARRGAGIVLLTMSVIAGSVVGFYALTQVFETSPRRDIAAPSASNGMIVFERGAPTGDEGSHLWIANPDGSDEQQLTFGQVMDRWPSWSPDGTEIVFTRLDYANDSFGLWVIDAMGAGARMITPPRIGAARGDWSPDGTRIAFSGVMGETPQSGIYVVDADGTGLQQITDPRFLAPDNPEWSPDGTTIAFSGNLDESRDSWDVYLINPDGTGLRNVSATADESHSEGVIGWLPNGNLLVRDGPGRLSSGPDTPIQAERWVEMASDGELVRVIFEGPANTDQIRQGPSLSPDGRFVVFDTSDADGNTVRFMDLETGAVTAVTNGHTPAWQPILGATIEPSPSVIVEPTPTSSAGPLPSGNRDSPVVLQGVPFPVCDLDAWTWRFSAEGIGQAFTFEQASGDVCDARVEGPQYLGVTTEGGEGISRADAYFGPLTRCVEPTGCWIYASVELIDGDWEDEILLGTNGFPGGIEVWFFDVISVDGRYEVTPFESHCLANADCDPMMIRTIDWELPGLNGVSCGRYAALDGSYSYSAGELFEWTSDTGDGWTADQWVFENGQARVLPSREVVSHGDPREEFAPSDDGEICLQPAAVAPSVLAD